MKIVAVTGANGFIGRHLCVALSARGYHVRACIRPEARIPDELRATSRSIEIHPVNLKNGHALWESACAGSSTVFHLAARVHVMNDTVANPLREFQAVNVEQTRQLAETAASAGVKRFVYLSSIKVNGDQSPAAGFRASDPPRFTDPYGQSKWEAEQCLRKVSDETGLEVVTVRPPLVYGPAVKGNFATLLRIVQKGIPLPFGLIRNQRSLVSVANLCSLLITASEHPAAPGECFLVRDQNNFSTPELIAQIGLALGRRPRLVPVPLSTLRWGARLTGKTAAFSRLLSDLTVDSSETERRLGWHPPFSTAACLSETAEWFTRTRGGNAQQKRMLHV